MVRIWKPMNGLNIEVPDVNFEELFKTSDGKKGTYSFYKDHVFKYNNGIIYAYKNKDLIWQNESLGIEPSHFEVPVGNSLFIQTREKLYVLDINSGKVTFSFTYDSKNKSKKIASPQEILFITDEYIALFDWSDSLIYCMNKTNGAIQWKITGIKNTIPQTGNISTMLPYMHAKIDNTIIYATFTAVYLINIKSGKNKKIKLKGVPVLNYFVKENDALYILDEKAKLHRFSLPDLQKHSGIEL